MGFRCGSEMGLLFWGLGFEGLQGGNMSCQTSCEMGVVCNIVCWSVMAGWLRMKTRSEWKGFILVEGKNQSIEK